MVYKQVMFILIIFNLGVLIINEYRLLLFKEKIKLNDYSKNDKTIKVGRSFFKNYYWMPNNNVMQYSSYIFIKNSYDLFIRSLITVNRANIREEEFSKSEFFCSIMSIKSNNQIDIVATNVINLIHKKTKVVECYYDKLHLININDISVAIIRNNDFSHLKKSYLFNGKIRVLPYFMINYQIPAIKRVNAKKIKNIAICVQFTYNLSPLIKDWVKIHEQLKIPKIILYDSTVNDSLINYIKINNLSKIVQVRPYYFDEHKTCSLETLNWYINNEYENFDAEIYRDICFSFAYSVKFNYSNFESRLIHEDLSANDCYITENEYFEFVGLYDFDEIIFPRRFENDYYGDVDSCHANNKICSKYAFTSSLYDYLIKLIINQFSEKINKLNSIYFDAGLYLELNYNINNLMTNLNDTFHSLFKTGKLNDTINISLDNKTDHKLLIHKNDYNYVEELIKNFDTFNCLKNIFTSKNIKYLNSIFSRFLYLIIETKPAFQRPFKCLHYTNNVKAIYTHGSILALQNSNYLLPSIVSGHFLSHFRSNTTEHIQKNNDSSITKFQIDFEYMNYLIHNLTNYC